MDVQSKVGIICNTINVVLFVCLFSGSSEGRLTQPPSMFKLPAVAQEAVSFKTINRSSFHKPYENKND